MMSDFFESFLTPLNPIFAFFNPISWGLLDLPPLNRTSFMYTPLADANSLFALLYREHL